MEKIFINIASYRDPTITDTIREALNNSKNPERLVFGLGMQYYDYEYPDLSFIDPKQLKIINYDVDNRPGVVKIRYEISNLVSDEDYFLIIDSHTSFSEFWDYNIIKDFKDLAETVKTNNFVFTGYRQGEYIAGSSASSNKYLFLERYDINFLRIVKSFERDKWEKTKTLLGLNCGMMFAERRFLNDVGLDKYSNFIHEEPYMAWRLYMNNWRIYVPENARIHEDDDKKRKYIKNAWNDDETIPRFISKDSEEDIAEMFITFLTNLQGKYSISNAKNDVNKFFTEKNTLVTKNIDLIRRDIFKINEMLNKNKHHPITPDLVKYFIFLYNFMK